MERIQDIRHLALSSYENLWKKKRCDVYLKAEGFRLAELALKSSFTPEALLVSSQFLEKHPQRMRELERMLMNKACPRYLLSERLMARFSETKSPQGVILILKSKTKIKTEEFFSEFSDMMPFRAIVLEDLQDPGNVGSIVRTAEAFGYNAVFYTEGTAQPFAEKAMRASMGSVFFIPIIKVDNIIDLLAFFEKKNIISIATSLRGENLETFDKPSRLVLLIGNEGKGLSHEVLWRVNRSLKIPMVGEAESLNAAAAAAIVAYYFRG